MRRTAVVTGTAGVGGANAIAAPRVGCRVDVIADINEAGRPMATLAAPGGGPRQSVFLTAPVAAPRSAYSNSVVVTAASSAAAAGNTR